jgi:hypothetical protein
MRQVDINEKNLLKLFEKENGKTKDKQKSKKVTPDTNSSMSTTPP